MDEKKVLTAIEDQEFLVKVLNMDSLEDVQAAFKQDKDIDITIEELKSIRKTIEEKIEGELSDDSLDNVAGGIAITGVPGGGLGGKLNTIDTNATPITYSPTVNKQISVPSYPRNALRRW